MDCDRNDSETGFGLGEGLESRRNILKQALGPDPLMLRYHRMLERIFSLALDDVSW
jgi:hypothetical protein